MVHMIKEIMEEPQVLERCRNGNQAVVRQVVAEIEDRGIDSACIAARGTSDHAGIYGKYVLELAVGIPVSMAASSVVTLYGGSVRLKRSLVIGISQSGKAADVLEVIRDANGQGALTVSITNDPESPLAREARYHLYCEAGEEKSVAATKTFSAQVYLLAMLAAEWSKDADLAAQLADVPGKLAEVLALDPELEQMVQRYRFMDECFVLARGVNYAVAMEAALKIQETTYARAKAFATSDFQHGPIAMADEGIPVMLLAPSGPSLQDVGDMARRLSEAGNELIIFSNDEDILALGNTQIPMPACSNDFISPFYHAAAIQLFACRLSLAKGLNPDSPRRLKKVTITR